jgi:hypothetical protein
MAASDRFRRFSACIAVLIALCAVSTTHATSIRAYHIGNSVTDTLRYNGVNAQAVSMGHTYTYGKHISPGVRLAQTWNYQTNSGQQMYSANGFGLYRDALTNHTWDVVTMQPFDSILSGADGDLAMVKNFINYTLPTSPNARFYVYSRWPRFINGTLNYEQRWLTPYTYTGTNIYDPSNETRGYFQTLVDRVNQEMPTLGKRVLMVPVGDVLLEVDRRMRAGRIPGFSSVNQLFTDHIHFGDTGSYIVGMTFFATLYRDNPMGTAKPVNWANISSAQVAQFQEAVWQVVSGHAYSGVLRGDFNRDAAVTLADFSILANNFNRSVAGLGQGDADGNRLVNLSDFAQLSASFNNLAAAQARSRPAVVPEPSSFTAALLVLPWLLRRRSVPAASPSPN